MVLKTTDFNHEALKLYEATTVTKMQHQRCRERVFFATYANALQAIELYGEEDDCPKEFHSKTGDLKRALTLINDPLEYEYTLLMFLELHTLAHKSVEKWLLMNDDRLSNSKKSELKMMMAMEDMFIKHELEKKSEELGYEADLSLTLSNMMMRIDLVKSSHYSWETYYNMIKAKNILSSKDKSGIDFDIDDMLRGVFNKDDE